VSPASLPRIAVLVSGGGSNLQALLDAGAQGRLPSGELALVLSDRAGAYALERARVARLPAVCLPRRGREAVDWERELLGLLREHRIDLLVLAGFLSILGPMVIQAYPGRILNVHPSLIPAFCGRGYYGLRVHEAALARGVKLTGATVHLVNEEPDGGPILLQQAVKVLPGDTPQSLQRRVMEQAEWQLLPLAVERVCHGLLTERNQHAMLDLCRLLRDNPYPGRGLVMGMDPSGGRALLAYFIMGRSENSRNRVFFEQDGELRIRLHKTQSAGDTDLILYRPTATYNRQLIVTNGDQTDTILVALSRGGSFESALRGRSFEPDAPHFTPRISGVMTLGADGVQTRLSILRAADSEGSACDRLFFEYPGLPGRGRFLHTYQGDGAPLPAFEGEPRAVAIPGDIPAFAKEIWDSLNVDNRVALWVRAVSLEGGPEESYLFNRHPVQKGEAHA
jgi:phosphoribosylglycinamide formyltransferase-1